jgi:hypothetical protein
LDIAKQEKNVLENHSNNGCAVFLGADFPHLLLPHSGLYRNGLYFAATLLQAKTFIFHDRADFIGAFDFVGLDSAYYAGKL